MSLHSKQILHIGIMLAIFAAVATSLVASTHILTRDKINDNERIALLKAINEIVDANEYDNDILTDTKVLEKTKLLATKSETIIYRARKNKQPVAVIFTSIAPDGYSGRIKLLVGIYNDGSLAGVRVIDQKETPGLGDKINEQKSNWIFQFKGLSLTHFNEDKWAVKKDGGQFDQFTGATITPRAVVKAIKHALIYFNKNRDDLFTQAETK